MNGRFSSHIERFFRQRDGDLREWFFEYAGRDGINKIAVIRDALACLRQVQSHAAAAGLSWQEWIATVSQPCFCCRENNGCWPGCSCNVNVQPESEE